MRTRVWLWLGLGLAAICWLLPGERSPARAQDAGGPPGRAFVANRGSNTVSVIDTATNQVVGEPIPVGKAPNGVAVSQSPSTPPSEARVYVTNFDDNTVSVLDPSVEPVQVVETVQVGSGPTGLALSRDDLFAYVANFNDGTVSILDLAGPKLQVAQTMRVQQDPSGVTVSRQPRILVTNSGSDSITSLMFDPRANGHTVAAISLPVGSRPLGVATSGPTLRIYVANAGGNSVSVIAAQITRPVPVGMSPTSVAVSPEGARAYVTNLGDNTVSVIDIPPNQPPNRVRDQEIGRVPVGRGPIGAGMSQDGTRVYVTNSLDDTVSVIDTTADPVRVIATVKVGKGPNGVAVQPQR